MGQNTQLLIDLILDFLNAKNFKKSAELLKKEYETVGLIGGTVVSQLEVLLEGLPASFSLNDSKGADFDSVAEDRHITDLWNLEEHGPNEVKTVYTNPAFDTTASPRDNKSTHTLLQQLYVNLNEYRRDDEEDQWSEEDVGYRRLLIDDNYLLEYPDEFESEEGSEKGEIKELSPSNRIQSSSGSPSTIKEIYPNDNKVNKEPEYDSFDLKVIYVKNHTGFEESKDFPIKIDSVIAGRYEIKEYLGSAAFSRAIQCYDIITGRNVCIKIITNNKDFFDQSLDEIKLLTYINANADPDSKNVLQIYDYFYFKEHLFIVCELLRDNLYEFYKYNRESGDEIYFNIPRLKSVARQCLVALEYIHGLSLIHCDLKPENILIKSYSRCEVKVIDFGSSCYTNDHLGHYIQSRAYRAPEVILGLPYDCKIDIWSLGCILAELWTGSVLFVNDSIPSLLARINGMLGPFPKEMLEKGKYTSKFFTKRTNVLYEKRDSSYSFLCPKKTSLKHRLKVPDELFIDFISKLLILSPSERLSASEALNHPWLNS
eukprot:TRINITY_DN2318_c0_g1_i2.p1 TRINITY_DN2318_c0_g1~~TRINITY_DN2318_c0_g1_i2.p1  ORF type:complete len:542 (+),score=111.83 TRINITY_DN2318_c0_g1_i2:322-1947(+)